MFNPHPVLATIGNFEVTSHGVAFAVAGLCALAYLAYRAPGWGWTPLRGAETALWIFLCGLLGARLAYLLWYREEFSDVTQIFAIWQGGLISFGGLVAGVIAALSFARSLSPSQFQEFGRSAGIATLGAWAIGRIGNYYGYETFGVTSDFFSVFYGRVPIQLFEALACAVLAVVFHRIAVFDVRLPFISYLVVRFAVDFWRDEAMLGVLRQSQWAALVGICILAAWILYDYLRKVRA